MVLCLKNLFHSREKIDISDIADAAVRILIHARSMDGKVTALKLVDALLGKGACKIPSWKKPPENLSKKSQIEHIIASLLIDGYLREDFHYTPYNTISYILPGNRGIRKPLVMGVPQAKGVKRKKQPTKVIDISDSDEDFS